MKGEYAMTLSMTLNDPDQTELPPILRFASSVASLEHLWLKSADFVFR